jgi:plasmid stabilization system protein ParE
MSYQIHITPTAEHDIVRAADYIEFTLKNPEAADNLLDVVTEQIEALADFPQKFRLVDDPVLTSWGIRFVIINNYLAFYMIDEEKQVVIVVRFLYQKSNWTSILRQGFSLI